MNVIFELLSSSWAQALVWTLLHSLWQSLIVLLVVTILFRYFPAQSSYIKYNIATVSIFLLLLSTVATFCYLYITPSDIVSQTYLHTNTIARTSTDSVLPGNFVYTISYYVPVIIALWMAGVLIFLLRITIGLWYIHDLKSTATYIPDGWAQRVYELAAQLNISCRVTLAESAKITAPAVIGFIKPIILVPTGMFSGLSTAQLEAIFIHELMHIKRNDYIINILQSIVEAILFFNPFVWILSGIVRREREHCCDDGVMIHQADPAAYVRALALLEETRLARQNFVLSIRGHQNQLLARIKRIMERSAKSYSSRERALPAMLLAGALLCTSWITIGNRNDKITSTASNNFTVADTTIKDENTATYSKKEIITIGPDGKPHQEVKETFSGEENWRKQMEMLAQDLDNLNLDMPIDFIKPPIPDLAIPQEAFFGNFNFDIDTIPDAPAPLTHNWEMFSQDLTKHFQENFGDFFKDEQEIMKMMEGIEHFHSNFNTEWIKEMEDLANNEAIKEFESDTNSLKLYEMQVKDLEENLRQFEDRLQKSAQELEQNMPEVESQLRKDGYLKDDEVLDSISWDEEGNIKVNGKTIKLTDQKKYKELH